MEGFLPTFKKELKDKKETLTQRLTNGSCEDYATYRAICGELKGISDSLLILSESVKKYAEDGEDFI